MRFFIITIENRSLSYPFEVCLTAPRLKERLSDTLVRFSNAKSSSLFSVNALRGFVIPPPYTI